jgi:hypothetical protein
MSFKKMYFHPHLTDSVDWSKNSTKILFSKPVFSSFLLTLVLLVATSFAIIFTILSFVVPSGTFNVPNVISKGLA